MISTEVSRCQARDMVRPDPLLYNVVSLSHNCQLYRLLMLVWDVFSIYLTGLCCTLVTRLFIFHLNTSSAPAPHNACQGRPSSSAAPRACRDDVMWAVSVTLGPRWLFKCSLVKTKLLISHRAHKLQVKSVKALSVICLGTETDPFKNWKLHTCKQKQL